MPESERSGLHPLQPRTAFLVFFAVVGFAFIWLILRPLLAPTVLAILASVLFHPVHTRLEVRLGIGSGRAAFTSLVVLSLFVGGPAVGVAFLFMVQARRVLEDFVGMPEGASLTSRLAQLVEQYLSWLDRISASYLGEAIDLQTIAAERLQATGASIYGALPDLLEYLTRLLLAYLVFMVALFFLLRDGRRLMAVLLELSPLDDRHTNQIVDSLEQTIRAVFLGALVTALVQGSVGGIGFLLAGFDNFVIWGVIVAVASFVPVFGTALVWVPAVLYLLPAGNYQQALILLAFGVAISTGDNLLRIVLIGGRTALHPLILFIAAFGGLAAGGPIGLIYGLLLAAMLHEAVRIYRGEFGALLAPATPD